MNLRDEIASDLAEVESDFKNTDGKQLTFTIGNTPYPCTAGSLHNSKDLGEGGWATSADLIINIRRALFTGAIPALKSKGVYSLDGKMYAIDAINLPPGVPFVKFALVDPTKGV